MAGLVALWHGSALAAPASWLRPEDHRLGEIAFRLARNGAPLCPSTRPLTGLLYHHLPEYEPADQRAVARQYGLDRGTGVLSVLADSPAADAGLVAGDALLAVNGRRLPAPPTRAQEEWRKALVAIENMIDSELQRGPARLRVLRDGGERELTLRPEPGCSARIRLARSRQVNAFASGDAVTMTTGLLAFTSDEDELAAIIAHELAHNILGHPAALDAQGVPGGVLRGIGVNAARVRATEEEADRLAIRLLWRAGYDVAAVIPFWRRFYARYDTPLQLFRTHPSLRARERLINEAIAALPR